MKVTVSRKAHFNAAHKLFRSDWSDEKNKEVFGKLFLIIYFQDIQKKSYTFRIVINLIRKKKLFIIKNS